VVLTAESLIWTDFRKQKLALIRVSLSNVRVIMAIIHVHVVSCYVRQ
jgi:hypothetical protein